MSVFKRNAGFFMLAVVLISAGFPRPLFAEKKISGFYAGALSVAAETTVETAKAKPVSDKDPKQLETEKLMDDGLEKPDEGSHEKP